MQPENYSLTNDKLDLVPKPAGWLCRPVCAELELFEHASLDNTQG